MTSEEKKVFCIGFNKTGTTSLHNLFLSFGLKSIHNTEWCHYSFTKDGKAYFDNQCYTDGELSHFIQLERWFPNSLYILNTRNKRDWLYSRIKHVMRHNENIEYRSLLSYKKYGKMAKEFYADEEAAIKKWVLDRGLYHKQVRTYFHESKNFLEVNVASSPQWAEEILAFFTRNKLIHSTKEIVKSIHVNKRNTIELNNKEQLSKYFRLVDKVVDC